MEQRYHAVMEVLSGAPVTEVAERAMEFHPRRSTPGSVAIARAARWLSPIARIGRTTIPGSSLRRPKRSSANCAGHIVAGGRAGCVTSSPSSASTRLRRCRASIASW
jgi:hypothetical protein